MIISIGIDIAKGLTYFEKDNILHKDIKLGNLLFSENMKVKIGFILLIFFFNIIDEYTYIGDLGQVTGLGKGKFFL
jgi:serine/threonine protein kinase